MEHAQDLDRFGSQVSRDFTCQLGFELIPVTREILLTAAALRARYHLKTPDAILIATGLQAEATAAVTKDSAWRGLADIKAIVLVDLT